MEDNYYSVIIIDCEYTISFKAKSTCVIQE